MAVAVAAWIWVMYCPMADWAVAELVDLQANRKGLQQRGLMV